MQFISSWNISLAGGSKIKMGSSLLSSSFHPIISEVVGRHHGNLSCFPDACLEDTPFEMLIQSITRWGNSPHLPSLLWEHPQSDEVNIIVLIWLFGVHPTDKGCCRFYQPWRYLEWGFNNSCTFLHKGWHFVHQFSAILFSLELEGRRTKVYGDSVQWDNSSWLSCFEGNPNFCGRFQSIDVMETSLKDYSNINISSMTHSKCRCLESVEHMYYDCTDSLVGCVFNMVDLITCSNVDILVVWELSFCDLLVQEWEQFLLLINVRQ